MLQADWSRSFPFRLGYNSQPYARFDCTSQPYALLQNMTAAKRPSAGIVDKPADLDVASVMAMGFPAWRGGIVFYGDLVGAGEPAGWACERLPACE